uniref:ATP synthase F0 subunit 8 n=1 Tax=Liphistius erawan TaxID=1155480 RepID=L7NW36_LIPER|nr:ATP synthase F0 subunit 8 [Liphistius erawan]AFC77872.1 ATP synthase F0 subunit 8 [Liphistius erawan]
MPQTAPSMWILYPLFILTILFIYMIFSFNINYTSKVHKAMFPSSFSWTW